MAKVRQGLLWNSDRLSWQKPGEAPTTREKSKPTRTSSKSSGTTTDKKRKTGQRVPAASLAEMPAARALRAWMGRPLVLRFKAPKVGDTIESPAWRLHRFATSIQMWDLKNAGKRGKKVRKFVWFNLDKAPQLLRRSIAHAIDLIANTTTFDDALFVVEEWAAWNDPLEDYPEKGDTSAGNTRFRITMERGVDVPASGERHFDLFTAQMKVDSDSQSFSVRDLKDHINQAAIIPPMKAKKTAIKQMHRWVADNERAILSGMTFRQLLKQLDDEGIKYHHYLMAD